jgi:hypothetical protein
MGKISAEAKKHYFERIKFYKQDAEKIMQREKNLKVLVDKQEEGFEYQLLALAEERLNLASIYVLMNNISLSYLGIKNDAFLNDARKSCYQSVIYLENVVTKYVDVPFSEYEEEITKIEGFTQEKRYALIQKLGYTIESVEEAFGENSKWRWSFVELEGRFTAVAKNILNLKKIFTGLDPRTEGYQFWVSHLGLVKKLLQKSADRYREKYELSTLRIDDFKQAISFLAALRRINILMGETEQSEIVKKKIEVWKQKMESDEKRKESKHSAPAGTTENST